MFICSRMLKKVSNRENKNIHILKLLILSLPSLVINSCVSDQNFPNPGYLTYALVALFVLSPVLFPMSSSNG